VRNEKWIWIQGTHKNTACTNIVYSTIVIIVITVIQQY